MPKCTIPFETQTFTGLFIGYQARQGVFCLAESIKYTTPSISILF